ncbi:hypothetical protein TIFTF001_038668 [Ficus carica]|uniref:Uncharacterized protein n=1 Tax=Ficus carica TaxID=3494 RepID=A0AA88EBW7_FICCA|nr:hypothetical protein TIFTF001_038668 [Ficus carica]
MTGTGRQVFGGAE